MAGIPDELFLARLRRETAAREAAIAALRAALDSANEQTQQKITVAASKLTTKIAGRTVNASAIAGMILRTQVEPGFALAEQVTALEAKVTDLDTTSAASITEIRTAMADQYEAQAQQTLTLQAVFNGNIATVIDQITVVSTSTSAVASRTTTLETTVNNPTTGVAASYARILAEETARATADTALATRATALESTVNNPTTGVAATAARLTTEETTRATEDTALATRATTLEATVNHPTTGVAASYARIIAEETARATADTALASRATTLEATVFSATDGNTVLKARIATEETARANGDSALATSISSVSATADGKNRTFYQSSTPTATAVGDIWIDITSTLNVLKRWNGTAWVDTQVASGAIGAAVATESSARATADGNLSGKYSLKVIAGNIVTGMNITSSTGGGTDVSDITFQASSFRIYNGVTATAPFSVSGGVVYMDDAVIRSTVDIGTGDARFYKPATGAATYGNTSQGHISMENYAIGTAAIRAKFGSSMKLDMRCQTVGADTVGVIYVYSSDNSTFLSIAGSVTAGSAPRLTWAGDTNLYRHTAGKLKTDGGFIFNGCELTQRIAKSDVLNLAGGVAEETFNVNISGYGFAGKPTAGVCNCASDKDYHARYDWDAAGNSATNAVIRVSRFDGANTSAGARRFSLVFFQ
jgi:hypothetical protein